MRSIAAQKLKTRYIKAIKNETLGGAGVLEQLAKTASECVGQTTGGQRVVAYTTYAIFGAAAYDYSGRPVSQSEVVAFLEQIHQPVIEAIEFLLETNPKSEAVVSLCERIIKTHLDCFPLA